MRPSWLHAAWLVPALLACGCSGQRADLDAVLAADRPAALAGPAGDPVVDPVTGADRRAAAARARVTEHPDDPAALVEGARALFLAADLRMQSGIVALLRADPPGSLAELLEAGDRLPSETRREVRALCDEGAALAERALAARPDDAGARTYYALNLSLVAWAEGAARALLQGMGPRVSKAIDAAVEADEGYEAMAPLRLSARFATQAPWPYRDRDAARELLERAVEAAPTPVHHLFLGDVLALQDEREEALAQWRLALDAEPDASTRLAADLHRELARLRLACLAPDAERAAPEGAAATD